MKMKIVMAAFLISGFASTAHCQQVGGFWQDQYGQTTCCGLGAAQNRAYEQSQQLQPQYEPQYQPSLPSYMPRQQYLPNQYDSFNR
jgi:hypothetical protein